MTLVCTIVTQLYVVHSQTALVQRLVLHTVLHTQYILYIIEEDISVCVSRTGS